MGHMTVAQIAYNQLTPTAKKQVDTLSNIMVPVYKESNNFISAAAWADDLKGHDVNVFNTWHYINIGFSTDKTPYPKFALQPNAVWAILQNISILESKKSLPQEKAAALQMLSHIVGDLHQPLHATSKYSKKYPKGNQGGTLFSLKKPYDNLHVLWDDGVTKFPDAPKRPLDSKGNKQVKNYAELLKSKYSMTDDPRLKITEPMQWAKESHRLGSNVYKNIKENTQPSAEYIVKNAPVAEEQVVLAGYRLAILLNKIFD